LKSLRLNQQLIRFCLTEAAQQIDANKEDPGEAKDKGDGHGARDSSMQTASGYGFGNFGKY
jgi:hypothetical protein